MQEKYSRGGLRGLSRRALGLIGAFTLAALLLALPFAVIPAQADELKAQELLISSSNGTELSVGEETQLSWTAIPEGATDVEPGAKTVWYKGDDTDGVFRCISVDENGKVRAIAPGTEGVCAVVETNTWNDEAHGYMQVSGYIVLTITEADDSDGNVDDPSDTDDAQPGAASVMYRLYNPNSGEHFYTSSASERAEVLVAGWTDEGVGWTSPATSNTPVYRLYNPYGGEHHYTLSAEERDMLVAAGWSDEGIGWYSDDAQGVPVYRQYNPNAFANNHNYTTSKDENDYLVSQGWQEEGVCWYGVA